MDNLENKEISIERRWKQLLPFLMPLFRPIIFIVVGVVFALLFSFTMLEAASYWSIICVISNLFTIGVLIWVFKVEKTSYKEIIHHSFGKYKLKHYLYVTIFMLLIGVGGMYLFGFIIYGNIPSILIHPIPVLFAVVNVILLPLTIVFSELPLYIGYAFPRIEKRLNSKILAFSYVFFFYALQHSFMPVIFDMKYISFRFFSFIPLMIFLGYLYNRRRDLLPLMIGHGVLDFATGIQILIMSLYPAIYDLMV